MSGAGVTEDVEETGRTESEVEVAVTIAEQSVVEEETEGDMTVKKEEVAEASIDKEETEGVEVIKEDAKIKSKLSRGTDSSALVNTESTVDRVAVVAEQDPVETKSVEGGMRGSQNAASEEGRTMEERRRSDFEISDTTSLLHEFDPFFVPFSFGSFWIFIDPFDVSL